MLRYFAKKLITLILLLLLVSFTVFSVLFVLPGDPAQIILGINATPESLAALRADLGLDRSFMGQYLDWIAKLMVGQSHRSIHYQMPVFDLIAGCLAVTGPLAFMAMLFAVAIALPFGIYAARSDEEEKSGKFGTHTLVYTDVIKSKFDSNGSGTLHSGMYITGMRNCCDCRYPCPWIDPDGSFSIIVVGYIDDYLAISTTEARTQ